MSRRDFLKTVGVGVVGLSATAAILPSLTKSSHNSFSRTGYGMGRYTNGPARQG